MNYSDISPHSGLDLRQVGMNVYASGGIVDDSLACRFNHKYSKAETTTQENSKKNGNEHLKVNKKYTENSEVVFKRYNGDRAHLQKIQECSKHCFTFGASICLICIGYVKLSSEQIM